MKQLWIMKKIGLYLLGAIIVSCFSSSCASIVPVTDRIIQEVGGEDQLANFQYYISRDIVLNRFEHETDGNVAAGEAKISETFKKDRVRIKKSTPGVVIYHYYSDVNKSHFLHVAFEDNDDRYLQFAHIGNDNPGAFYSLVNHLQSPQYIIYDNTVYDYSFPENFSILGKVGIKKTKDSYGETPILLIKLKRNQKTIITKRTAKGRRIGQ